MGKAAAAAMGTGLAGIGGVGIWLTHSSQSYIVPHTPLVSDTSFLENGKVKDGYKDKYAAKYANFLVAAIDDNSKWWDWSFDSKYEKNKDKAKGGFKDLVRGAKWNGSTDGKSIQETCDKAYKSETSKVVDAMNDEADKFLSSQVWEYCSIIPTAPKTLDDMSKGTETNEDKTKLEGEWKDSKFATEKKADLLAIFTKDNEAAWGALNHRWSSAKGLTGFFAHEAGKTIKDKCEQAYKLSKSTTDTNNPSEEDLYKWCSPKGYKETTTSSPS